MGLNEVRERIQLDNGFTNFEHNYRLRNKYCEEFDWVRVSDLLYYGVKVLRWV